MEGGWILASLLEWIHAEDARDSSFNSGRGRRAQPRASPLKRTCPVLLRYCRLVLVKRHKAQTTLPPKNAPMSVCEDKGAPIRPPFFNSMDCRVTIRRGLPITDGVAWSIHPPLSVAVYIGTWDFLEVEKGSVPHFSCPSPWCATAQVAWQLAAIPPRIRWRSAGLVFVPRRVRALTDRAKGNFAFDPDTVNASVGDFIST